MKDRPHVRVDGVLRFKANRIVSTLLSKSVVYSMNEISFDMQNGLYTRAEWNEFLKLIGYSLSGYEEVRR